MVEFTAVINDPKTGKSYKTKVTGHHANSLLGKKIGDEFDGIFVGLPGYKLMICGGSDKDGFPMRSDLYGMKRWSVLVTKGVGFRAKKRGLRKKRTFRGNTISPDIVQVNMRITSHGSKPIDDLLKIREEKS